MAEINLTSGPDLWPQSGDSTAETVTINALEGNDTVTGTSFSDVLLGNQGNDILNGGQGNDTIYGGQGDDSLGSVLGNNLLFGNLGNDLIIAGTGNDEIYGGQNNDTVVGGGGNDSIFGNLGDDSLVGGSGNDYIHGGQDNDIIVASAGIDTLIGGVGEDTLRVTSNIDLSISNVISIETFDVAEAVTLTASFDNLEDVSILSGSGTIKILGTTIQVQQFLATLGNGVSQNLTIQDQDGNNVNTVNSTLTVGQDIVSTSGVINAPVVFVPAIGNTPTLESVDVLEGTGTDDLLLATMDGTIFGADGTLEITPRITGIETINIRAIKDVEFDAINTTGTNTFISGSSTATLDIRRIQNSPEAFIARNASGSFIATVADLILSGGNDSVKIVLENVNGIGEEISIGSITGNQGYETFNIESTGTVINRLNRIVGDNGGDLKTINITGDQDLELIAQNGVFEDSVEKIDASGLVGNLSFVSFTNNILTFIGGEGDVIFDYSDDGNEDLTFTGGKGNVALDFSGMDNDKLVFTGGEGDVSINMGENLTDNDKIDGGVGDNSITATFTGNVGPLEIKNVQTLLLTTQFNAPANVSFDKSDNSIDLIRITNDGVQNDLTIDAIKSLPTIELQGNNLRTADNSKIFSNLTILSTAVSGTDDTLAIDINNQGTQIDSNVAYDFNGVRADGVENFELTIADGNLNSATNIGGDIRSTTLKSVKVTSANNVFLGNLTTSGANSITSVDSTGVTNRFDAKSDRLAENAVINLGNGGGKFDATGSTTNGIKFNGGTGVDTIIGSSGNDVITGNAGADIIDLMAGGKDRVILNQIATRDSITGFNLNNDEIALSNATYGTLSQGQKYDIISAANFNPANNNVGSTIIQGTTAEIQGLGNTLTSRVRFVSVTGTDANNNGTNDTQLFYSANGSFSNLGNANSIALLDNLGGFTPTILGSNEIIPIA
ncbi:alkaline phosphatase [Geminocystis sp. NIES-3708]|uniref:calcium-binding protein n=1 Tax=Geminocystis sp. NIES-3708 TaxID=1615909 RepID=UPI0005FCD21D|nr:calcium-binding protein [Geminocystis sp. NIES-3708]BAQ61649.1 alkaline phosphatase [Geminocystis sp. NIES-3708]